MLQTIQLVAGQAVEFAELGDFLRILNAPYPLTVRYYKAGRELVSAYDVSGGYSEEFTGGAQFDRVRLETATTQEVQFVIRQGNRVGYDAPPVGQVSVTNTAGAFAHQGHTVTNASGQLLAANPGRRYLLIQNNDASGDVFVTTDGTDATTATGVKIGPGGSWEIAGYVPTGAVKAIGSLASNSNVITVEG